MKSLRYSVISIMLFVCCISIVNGQAPYNFNYQALIRNTNGALLANTNVSVRASIVEGSVFGSSVFVETHSATTNNNGLLSLIIGNGTATLGTLESIKWSKNEHFLKIEIDPNGGTNYSIETVTQLLSVPYALHSNFADSTNFIEKDPIYTNSVSSKINSNDTARWGNKLSKEIDGSITNEIQYISISNDTIYLSNGGFVVLPKIINHDNDSTNELQAITLNGNNLVLNKNGGSVTLPDNLDNDSTNELQIISISNDTIFLENGGFAKLPIDKTFDGDSSANNEIQYISKIGNALTLSSGGSVLLNDEDSTNELQFLRIANDTIFLTNGGFVKLPFDKVFDGDSSITNEIQSLSVSLTGDTLSLSKSNSIIVPGISNRNSKWQCGDVLIDVVGIKYPTTQIGDQCWMAQNLRTTKYADGKRIPLITSSSNWNSLVDTSRACAFYNFSSSTDSAYGLLYTWAAATNQSITSYSIPSGVQGACPDGWHLPSDAEYSKLANAIGGPSIAAYMLKNNSNKYWKYYYDNGDFFGFNAIPAGNITNTGSSIYMGQELALWTTSRDIPSNIYTWTILEGEKFYRTDRSPKNGNSIRCIKN
jgi:uncharacterized protein (TIGR02145 family)